MPKEEPLAKSPSRPLSKTLSGQSTGEPPEGADDYLRPSGVDRYLRPGGVDLYKRPA